MALDTSVPRSRRTIIAAALGGVSALVASAFGRPRPAEGAAGDAMRIGQNNDSGSSQTVLTSAAGGAAFTLKDIAVGGTGIFGWSSALSGTGRGLYGRADAPHSFGVQAKNNGAAGTGAALQAIGGNNIGVHATGSNAVVGYSSVEGYASVYGSHLGVDGYGVYGTASGSAVYGTSNVGMGVHGVTSDGIGVRGVGSGTLGEGVHGISVNGIGVFGNSTNYVGVFGTSANWFGVYGYSDSTWSGYFPGSLYAASSSASVKAFRIDHPVDPANKVLSHSCVESNERKLVYDGLVSTDASGEATVVLPAYFAALNKDVRYQLTVVGSFAQAVVKREIANGRFTIGTTEPRTKVSWMVTGVRQDAYAKAHPLKVEEVKSGLEKGRYLNPIEHGQPESKAVDFELRQADAARRASAAAERSRAASPLANPAATAPSG